MSQVNAPMHDLLLHINAHTSLNPAMPRHRSHSFNCLCITLCSFNPMSTQTNSSPTIPQQVVRFGFQIKDISHRPNPPIKPPIFPMRKWLSALWLDAISTYKLESYCLSLLGVYRIRWSNGFCVIHHAAYLTAYSSYLNSLIKCIFQIRDII
jgi:hypothetical protein